jgi:hypothetical protein
VALAEPPPAVEAVSPDRVRYGAQQARLLGALRAGGSIPQGFVASDVRAAADSLLRKRAGAVVRSWPALIQSLGDDFLPAFERYARGNPPPAAGDGVADGLAFAASLDSGLLSDGAKAEVALARGSFSLRQGMARPRLGPYLAAHVLQHPTRLLVVFRLPGLGRRHIAISV